MTLLGVNITQIELLNTQRKTGGQGHFWSTWTATGTPKDGGEPIKDRGNSGYIVRRQDDGSWEIARLTTHGDQPPASSK